MMTTQAWKDKMKNLKQVFSLVEICKLLGVDPPDEDSDDGGWTYMSCYDEMIKEGKSEEEAEEIALKYEQQAQDEAYNEYHDAVLYVAEKLFGEHHLILKSQKNGLIGVYPKETWRESAWEIMRTINGVGMFEFANVQEFCSSGPYTERQAVLSHLPWIRDYPRVYGGDSVGYMIERRLR